VQTNDDLYNLFDSFPLDFNCKNSFSRALISWNLTREKTENTPTLVQVWQIFTLLKWDLLQRSEISISFLKYNIMIRWNLTPKKERLIPLKKNSEKVILVQEWQIFTLLKWDLLFRNEIHSEGVNLTLKEWKSATLEQEWLFHYFFQVWPNFQSLPMRLHEIQRVLFAIVAKLLYVSQFYISIYFKLHFRFLTLSRKIYYLCLKFYSFFKILNI